MIYLDVLHFGRSRLGFLQSTYPCTGVTWDVTSLKVFNWVKEGSGYTVYRCIQYLHTTTLLLWCCRLIVWTCLDPAFPFFLCQSSCATLCAHIHHKKNMCLCFKEHHMSITNPRSWWCHHPLWEQVLASSPTAVKRILGSLATWWMPRYCFTLGNARWPPCEFANHSSTNHSAVHLVINYIPKVSQSPYMSELRVWSPSPPPAVPLRPRRQPAVPPSPWAPAARARQPGKPMGETGKTQENQNTGAELSTVNSHLTRSVQRQLSEPLRWCPLAWAISIIFFRNWDD